MFIPCVEHYHQWLRTAIPFKTKFGQIPSDSVRVQGLSKRPSSGHLYPVSSVKVLNQKGGKCKISRVLQSPVPSTQASPKVEASHRPKQAQYFSTHRKVQNGMDNSTVVAYIYKQGGTHSAEMCALLWKIMTWCHHYHITLKARHIPGCLNVMADLPGRTKYSRQNGHCICRCSHRSVKSGSLLM